MQAVRLLKITFGSMISFEIGIVNYENLQICIYGQCTILKVPMNRPIFYPISYYLDSLDSPTPSFTMLM